MKSTSLYLGDNPQLPLTGISCVMYSGLLLSGYSSDLSAYYYAGASAMWAQILWQIWTADVNDSSNLWARFNSNKISGGLLTAAIVAGHF